MFRDAWLPVGFQLPHQLTLKSVAHGGLDWQIVNTADGELALLAKAKLAKFWHASGLVEESLRVFDFAGEEMFLLRGGLGRALEPIECSSPPADKSDALARATTLRNTRRLDTKTPLHDAIYCELLSRLLPTKSLSIPLSDDIVLGKWLTGGVAVSVNSDKRFRALLGWLDTEALQRILSTAGFHSSTVQDDSLSAPAKFSLSGRPELERFFSEHIIDIIQNRARYNALGIHFPSAIALHGPTGCGKTYAVERLVAFLNWPSFTVDASTVGSPYIHETSRKVAELFNEAASFAPSVLIIDEMEAFLTNRSSVGASGHHHVEEVAEFLRRIPEASRKRVLIIGMTNQIEMIDPAILRRGRFDHVIKVGLPSKLEICELLKSLIAELPQEGSIDVERLAERLLGRPLSDVSYVVKDGARLAAKAGKDRIGQSYLMSAVDSIDVSRDDKVAGGKIGFI